VKNASKNTQILATGKEKKGRRRNTHNGVKGGTAVLGGLLARKLRSKKTGWTSVSRHGKPRKKDIVKAGKDLGRGDGAKQLGEKSGNQEEYG